VTAETVERVKKILRAEAAAAAGSADDE